MPTAASPRLPGGARGSSGVRGGLGEREAPEAPARLASPSPRPFPFPAEQRPRSSPREVGGNSTKGKGPSARGRRDLAPLLYSSPLNSQHRKHL